MTLLCGTLGPYLSVSACPHLEHVTLRSLRVEMHLLCYSLTERGQVLPIFALLVNKALALGHGRLHFACETAAHYRAGPGRSAIQVFETHISPTIQTVLGSHTSWPRVMIEQGSPYEGDGTSREDKSSGRAPVHEAERWRARLGALHFSRCRRGRRSLSACTCRRWIFAML